LQDLADPPPLLALAPEQVADIDGRGPDAANAE
jgi:hypothetical protein